MSLTGSDSGCSCGVGCVAADESLGRREIVGDSFVHWNPGCKTQPDGGLWCRRLFVAQWELEEQPLWEELEKVLRKRVEGMTCRLFGSFRRRRSDEEGILCIVMMLLDNPWSGLVEEIFGDIAVGGTPFNEAEHVVWCLPCCEEYRREVYGGWKLVLLSSMGNLHGQDIEWGDLVVDNFVKTAEVCVPRVVCAPLGFTTEEEEKKYLEHWNREVVPGKEVDTGVVTGGLDWSIWRNRS